MAFQEQFLARYVDAREHSEQELAAAGLPSGENRGRQCPSSTLHFQAENRFESGHWAVWMLAKGDGSWILSQYSTVPGYNAKMDDLWALVLEYLTRKSDGAINAHVVQIRYPREVTQQNGTDCGPLCLEIVRWLMEGGPLASIMTDTDSTRVLRRRMVYELERWS